MIEEKNDLLKVDKLRWFMSGDEFKLLSESEKNCARIVAFEVSTEYTRAENMEIE